MNGIGNIGKTLKRLSSGRTKRSIENDKPRANPTRRSVEDKNTGNTGKAGNAGNLGKLAGSLKEAIAKKMGEKSNSTDSFRHSFR